MDDSAAGKLAAPDLSILIKLFAYTSWPVTDISYLDHFKFG